MINSYFKEYNNKYHTMKSKLKRYVEAKQDFCNLTGVEYSDMPKAKGKALGFDDLLANIEELYNDYIEAKKKYDEEKDKCMKSIERLDNPIHKAIIEYVYLNFENNKEIAISLQEYHNKIYSLSYISELKAAAINKFEEII